MVSAKSIVFHYKELFQLKAMASTKANGLL